VTIPGKVDNEIQIIIIIIPTVIYVKSDDTTFGKITDFTPGTVRKLIRSGEIDARISINRMEIMCAIEDLISDGIMSREEGDEIMKVAREILTTEQLLYRKTKRKD